MVHTRFAAVVFAVALSLPSLAFAQDDEPKDAYEVGSSVRASRRLGEKEERNIDQRLAFLEKRIAIQHLHAKIWWGTWLSFYSAGAIVQTARAVRADERAEQADLAVSAVKAVGGVVRYLVEPMKGIRGFDRFPGESKQARLARGERILVQNAKATTPFGPWYAHLINLGINGAGAVIVGAGFDDWRQGLISAGIGFAVGEVSLLTQPWEADRDLEEYEARFGTRPSARSAPKIHWTIQPSVGGAALNATF